MANFTLGAGTVVAGDVRGAVAALDDAMLGQARLAVSALEATKGAGVPIAESQKVFRALSSGFGHMVEGRQEIVAAVRHMTSIKRHSNIRMEDFGCPDGWSAVSGLLASAADRGVDA